jgi:uncharacterized protein (DUF697 family)
MAQSPGSQTWAQELVASIVRWGMEGAPLPNPLPGGQPLRLKTAQQLAQEYRARAASLGLRAAIAELVEDQARWNAGTGFVTGLGGFALLPLQLPAAVTATWVIQTRMVAAIADLYGFDLDHEAVRTQILLTLIGEEAGEVLKQVGLKASQRLLQAQLRRLSPQALGAVNQAVGFRLLSRFSGKGLLKLNQAIPLLGGVVGGGIDYVMTRQLGGWAAEELGRRVPQGAREDATVIDVEILS